MTSIIYPRAAGLNIDTDVTCINFNSTSYASNATENRNLQILMFGSSLDIQNYGIGVSNNTLNLKSGGEYMNHWITGTNALRLSSTNAIFSGNITATGEITAYSDKRLKSDIKNLENRGKLKPVTFIKNNKKQIGFIAQDVQKLYPEIITVDSNSTEKYLLLNYMQLTAVLSSQINELYTIIEEQQKQINNLINKNNGSTTND
jgi:hypothetical protein